jgi:PadR family transcriptional regulator PadR
MPNGWNGSDAADPVDRIRIYMRIMGVRRKAGSLVPLETAICAAAAALRRRGIEEFHGYELAKQLAHVSDRRLLTAYGTLYRALGRLEARGLLESRREDPAIAAKENRPGRRFYTLTPLAESVVPQSSPSRRRVPVRRRRGEAPA